MSPGSRGAKGRVNLKRKRERISRKTAKAPATGALRHSAKKNGGRRKKKMKGKRREDPRFKEGKGLEKLNQRAKKKKPDKIGERLERMEKGAFERTHRVHEREI